MLPALGLIAALGDELAGLRVARWLVPLLLSSPLLSSALARLAEPFASGALFASAPGASLSPLRATARVLPFPASVGLLAGLFPPAAVLLLAVLVLSSLLAVLALLALSAVLALLTAFLATGVAAFTTPLVPAGASTSATSPLLALLTEPLLASGLLAALFVLAATFLLPWLAVLSRLPASAAGLLLPARFLLALLAPGLLAASLAAELSASLASLAVLPPTVLLLAAPVVAPLFLARLLIELVLLTLSASLVATLWGSPTVLRATSLASLSSRVLDLPLALPFRSPAESIDLPVPPARLLLPAPFLPAALSVS